MRRRIIFISRLCVRVVYKKREEGSFDYNLFHASLPKNSANYKPVIFLSSRVCVWCVCAADCADLPLRGALVNVAPNYPKTNEDPRGLAEYIYIAPLRHRALYCTLHLCIYIPVSHPFYTKVKPLS